MSRRTTIDQKEAEALQVALWNLHGDKLVGVPEVETGADLRHVVNKHTESLAEKACRTLNTVFYG